jgi:hypothetical protein
MEDRVLMGFSWFDGDVMWFDGERDIWHALENFMERNMAFGGPMIFIRR